MKNRFRVWDKRERELKNVTNMSFCSCHGILGGVTMLNESDYFFSNDENFVLEQCTGLKDKNGKLIYEGDILSFTVFDYNDYDTQYTGVVVYHGSRYTIWNNPDSEYYGSDGGFDLDWVIGQDCEIEIIGNIHENPELLKVEGWDASNI